MLPVSHGTVEDRFWWQCAVSCMIHCCNLGWARRGGHVVTLLRVVQLLMSPCVPSNCAFCLESYKVLRTITHSTVIIYLFWGPWLCSRPSDSVRAGRFEVRTPVGARDFLFSTSVQTGTYAPQWVPGGGGAVSCRDMAWPPTSMQHRVKYGSLPTW